MDKETAQQFSEMNRMIQDLMADNLHLRAKIHALQDGLISMSSALLKKPERVFYLELKRSAEYWHQMMLEEMERVDPAIAAQVDRREPSNVWLPDEHPGEPPKA